MWGPSFWSVFTLVLIGHVSQGLAWGSHTSSTSHDNGEFGSNQSSNRWESIIAGYRWWVSASAGEVTVATMVKDSRVASILVPVLPERGQRQWEGSSEIHYDPGWLRG